MGPSANLRTILEEKAIVRDAFVDLARDRPSLRILEAGCGRRWVVDLGDIPHAITGVDLDERALAHRREVIGDLHHAVHGDLRTVRLEAGAFDAVYSAYVLEHVEGAEAVLDRFAAWLSPGGILVLKIPERGSVAGWFTRVLPFRVHVAFYRWVAENPQAGTPGHPPYPVWHEPIVSLEGIRRFCRGRGLEVVREFGLDFAYHYRHLPLTRFQRLKVALVTSLIRGVGVLSLGSLASRYSGLLFVIRKPVGGASAGGAARDREAHAADDQDAGHQEARAGILPEKDGAA